MNKYELIPQYSSRASFYGKAEVHDEYLTITLYSYKTPILTLDRRNGEITWHDFRDSTTTTAHIKEFFQQQGLKVFKNFKEIKKYYED